MPVKPEAEQQILQAIQRTDVEGATTLTVENYGEEILGFLISRTGNESDGNEAFSMFMEDVWRGLPGFAWKSTLRTWCYMLARNAAARLALRPDRQAARNLALSRVGALSQIAEQVRTRTVIYLRTETKSRMRVLRQRLPDDDQTLLMLRVDREMSYQDIAAVMYHKGDDVDPLTLQTDAARLRQRFKAAREKLKQWAREEGLIE